jgi:glycosyltransferase involved in cell wall biosynthesis
MTVCMLVWNYWPGREGGAERQCRKLSRALSARGVKIMVLTHKTKCWGRRTVFDQDIPIVRLGILAPVAAIALWVQQQKIRWSKTAQAGSPSEQPERTWGITTPFWFLARLSFMIAATRYLARQRRGLSLIHVYESNWIAGFASWLGQRNGLPVLLIGPDVPFRSTLLEWRLRNHFIALNNAMATELETAHIDPARIHLIPNGVDIPSAAAAPGENCTVLFVANFSQGPRLKAYDVLLKAWALIHRQNPGIRLIMIGGGDSRPWQKLAFALGCEDSVSFQGFRDDLEDEYRRAAVFVLPSRTEGMSNALLEAQSHGIPAVVSAIPGNLAVVSDGYHGLVVPVNDAEALAAAITRLLQDPPLRAKLGALARQRMVENFSFASVSALVHGLYSKITARGE